MGSKNRRKCPDACQRHLCVKIDLYAANHTLHNACRNSSSIQPAVVRVDIFYGLVMDDLNKQGVLT